MLYAMLRQRAFIFFFAVTLLIYVDADAHARYDNSCCCDADER